MAPASWHCMPGAPVFAQLLAMPQKTTTVIPAKAGIQRRSERHWVPAFAGTTINGRVSSRIDQPVTAPLLAVLTNFIYFASNPRV